MIEYYNESGSLVGVNPHHIVWYSCKEDHTVAHLTTGGKLRVWMSEEEFRLAIRDVAPSVCSEAPEPAPRRAGRILK